MSFAISCQIRIRRGYARASPPMASETTGSALPMPAAQPLAAPSLSCSKRGMSIEGIPSLGGPPDLISSNGTVCREKSVRGHSVRQLRESATAVPRVVPVAGAMSTANRTIARMRFRNLKGSPAEGLIVPSAPPDRNAHLFLYSLDRPKRLPPSHAAGFAACAAGLWRAACPEWQIGHLRCRQRGRGLLEIGSTWLQQVIPSQLLLWRIANIGATMTQSPVTSACARNLRCRASEILYVHAE